MNAFDRLALAESSFLTSQFLSPVLPGRSVRVRIDGVILSLKVSSVKGWCVLRPISTTRAVFVRHATMTEQQSYLNLFPSLRLILCRKNSMWNGVPASHSDKRFSIAGLAPVEWVEEVQIFDTVTCRFDGYTLWYDSHDDGRIALYLRQELQKLTEPCELEFSGLTPEFRDAYLMAYGPAISADVEAKRDKNEERLKSALRRAGADYQSYIEREQTYTVSYMVGGESHRSTVRKDTLQVESAGICLNNTDSRFDLQSLVSVISEGQTRNKIVRVGENMRDDYEDE